MNTGWLTQKSRQNSRNANVKSSMSGINYPMKKKKTPGKAPCKSAYSSSYRIHSLPNSIALQINFGGDERETEVEGEAEGN